MKTAIIVQARMSSQRLPGKVLRQVAQKPLLQYLIESLSQCRENNLVLIATSVDRSDDPVEDFCSKLGVAVHRGPLDDVAARFSEAASRHRLDAFARVSGDSPLIDHRLVDQMLSIFKAGDFDLVTNVMKRTFPKGHSVEIMRSSAFAKALGLSNLPTDREHVTPAFYRNPDAFSIRSVTSPEDRSSVNFCVDTPEDLARFEAIIAKMKKPHWQYSSGDLLLLAQS